MGGKNLVFLGDMISVVGAGARGEGVAGEDRLGVLLACYAKKLGLCPWHVLPAPAPLGLLYQMKVTWKSISLNAQFHPGAAKGRNRRRMW